MKGYILDLDNTLYDENQYLSHVFSVFWKKHEIDPNLFDQVSTQALSDQTRLDSKDIFKSFLKLTPLGYTKQDHDELFKIYTTLDCKLSLYEDAQIFLDYLRDKKQLIAILTNGPVQAQRNKIRNLGLSHIPVFYARENGLAYEKPHPNAFQRVLDFFSISPHECCMIGDHPQSDIYGANQVGITPIWLQRGYTKGMRCPIQCSKIADLTQAKEFIL